ncbi:MAG: hypothetical protein ACRD88_10775, partial [Terriglobia bacterium]
MVELLFLIDDNRWLCFEKKLTSGPLLSFRNPAPPPSVVWGNARDRRKKILPNLPQEPHEPREPNTGIETRRPSRDVGEATFCKGSSVCYHQESLWGAEIVAR